jgi:hypothetical protein
MSALGKRAGLDAIDRGAPDAGPSPMSRPATESLNVASFEAMASSRAIHSICD